MVAAADKTNGVESTAMYRLNGIPFVPHYVEKNKYVGPGMRTEKIGFTVVDCGFRETFTSEELLKLGATQEVAFLWPRLNSVNRRIKNEKQSCSN